MAIHAPTRAAWYGWSLWYSLRTTDWLEHFDQVDSAVCYICRYCNGTDDFVRRWSITKVARIARKTGEMLEKEHAAANPTGTG